MKKIFFGIIIFIFMGSLSSYADDGDVCVTEPSGNVKCTNEVGGVTNSDCSYDGKWDISAALKNCKPKGMIETSGNYKIDGGARDKIIAIANQIIAIGALLSVGAIVYAGLLYVMYAGDEDRVKKAKSSLKFGIIGFVVMLLSFPIVNMIVGLIYSVGG